MSEPIDLSEIRNGRYGVSVSPDPHGVVLRVVYQAGNGAAITLAMPLGRRQVDRLTMQLAALRDVSAGEDTA